jgi:6-phosphogluconolactonase (cycloisomerase 2 family)
MLYTLSNDSTHNLVFVYARRNGKLERVEAVDTRGRGDPSISGAVQGAIATDGRFLFAVDAGSSEITSFRVAGGHLHFASKVSSGGTQPVSLSVHQHVLYVLNAASSSIAGFHVSANGGLTLIRNSKASLSGTNVGPAEISFDSEGRTLIVTEKNTSKIDTYSLHDGVPTGPTVHDSAGTEPFGFAFVPGEETMVVSDAFNGQVGAGAASSYSLTPPSTLTTISAAIPDHNTAPCWVVITNNERIMFTSNTGSDTISSYNVDGQGKITLTTPDGISAHTGKGPADLALGPGDRFLFVANLKSRSIGTYAVRPSGKLTRVNDAPLLPANAVGLAALPAQGD